MILKVIGIIVIMAAFITAAADIIPLMGTWFSRIHIGRHSDMGQWEKDIAGVVSKWLVKTPKVKITDNTRLIIIDILKGNYSKDALQSWQKAALLLGAHEYMKNSADKLFESEFDSRGMWRNKPEEIDCAILAYALMKNGTADVEKYRPALDYTWNLIKEHIGDDGTVFYRKSVKEARFVDTIGLICPFLTAYGLRYHKTQCIDLAFRQIKQYELKGMIEKHRIPCHAYDIKTGMPLGLYGWGRGLGWYAIGLGDTLSQLPEDSIYRGELVKITEAFALSIMKLQGDDGAWTWNTGDRGARKDSSATAVLSWFLLSASEINGIKGQCLKSAEKGIEYLMKVTRRNGIVDFSQGDTKGMGVYSQNFDILPFTQGFALRAVNELRGVKGTRYLSEYVDNQSVLNKEVL